MTIPREILDDLSSRCIESLPPEEREYPVKVCFQAERAHWFYMDNMSYYEKTAPCPKCNVRDFIRQIFEHCSFLRRYTNDIDAVLDQWRGYKGEIPTHGAILLDEAMEHVLLVQGYHAKASWGFPKGKCNEEELPHHCAIREVKEETGFDISPLIDQYDYLQRHHNTDTSNRLYIVAGVPRDYAFKPTTRNEIKDCRWFRLDTLPVSKTDNTKSDLGIYPNNFYMVFPYVEQIRKWVAKQRRKRNNGNRNQNQSVSVSSTATTTPPCVMNGGGNYQQHSFSDDSQRRSSPRSRSFSHSSPSVQYSNGFAMSGGSNYSRQTNSSNAMSGYHKQQQHQKYQLSTPTTTTTTKQIQNRQKKTPGCRQKLDLDTGVTAATVALKKVDETLPEESTTEEPPPPNSVVVVGPSTATTPARPDIRPSRAWQQFTFNWEPIFSAM